MTERRAQEGEAPFEDLADDDLLAAVRSGETGAYSVLYHRYFSAALQQARRLGASHDPHDVAQEAFVKILKSTLRGGGPREGFAGYLMRVVRNESIDRSRRVREVAVEDVETVAPGGFVLSDGVDELFDRHLMRRAFTSLPENWQRILWLTEVEGETPRSLAPQLQQSSNAVAQLSHRAREGLRAAWLQAHVDVASIEDGCRQAAHDLGAYESGRLRPARSATVAEHLDGCLRCTAALAELQEISTRMRSLLLPTVLGTAALLESLGPVLSTVGPGALGGAALVGGHAAGAGSTGAASTGGAATATTSAAAGAAGAGAGPAVVLGSLQAGLVSNAAALAAAGALGVLAVGGFVVMTRDGTEPPGPSTTITEQDSVEGPTAQEGPPAGTGSAPESDGATADGTSSSTSSASPVQVPEVEADPVPMTPESPDPTSAGRVHVTLQEEPPRAEEPAPEAPTEAPEESDSSAPAGSAPADPSLGDPAPQDPVPEDSPSPVTEPDPAPTPGHPAPAPTRPSGPGPLPGVPGAEDPPATADPAEPTDPARQEQTEVEDPRDREPSVESFVPGADADPGAEGPGDEGPGDEGPADEDPATEDPTSGAAGDEDSVPAPDPAAPEPPDPVVEPTSPQVPAEPEEPSEPEQPAEVAPPAPEVRFPSGGSHALPVTLSGTGEPGATVRVRDQTAREVAAGQVAEDGTWSLTPAPGAPDDPTTYSVVQEHGGAVSPASASEEQHVYLAPELLHPRDGETIPGQVSDGEQSLLLTVLAYGLSEELEYSLIIDGRQWDLDAQAAGTYVLRLLLLGDGEHTIELAYRDAATGQLGARRTHEFTVR